MKDVGWEGQGRMALSPEGTKGRGLVKVDLRLNFATRPASEEP